MSGSDIKQGSAKQEFKQETNQPTVTFKVKSKDKFKKSLKRFQKRDNVMVVWMDFKKGDSYKKRLKQQEGKEPKYVSAANVDQPINSDSVEISGGFNGKKV